MWVRLANMVSRSHSCQLRREVHYAQRSRALVWRFSREGNFGDCLLFVFALAYFADRSLDSSFREHMVVARSACPRVRRMRRVSQNRHAFTHLYTHTCSVQVLRAIAGWALTSSTLTYRSSSPYRSDRQLLYSILFYWTDSRRSLAFGCMTYFGSTRSTTTPARRLRRAPTPTCISGDDWRD
jgi:hypothetical protein